MAHLGTDYGSGERTLVKAKESRNRLLCGAVAAPEGGRKSQREDVAESAQEAEDGFGKATVGLVHLVDDDEVRRRQLQLLHVVAPQQGVREDDEAPA